jgi:hypothetical protein
VPGIAVGLTQLFRAGRRGRTLVVLTLLLTVGFVFEAAVYGANGGYLYERFAFYVTPLFSIAFVWWWESGDGFRRGPYAAAAYVAAAGALLLPLTSTLDGSPSHSPTLAALRALVPIDQGGGKIVWIPALAAIAVAAALTGPTPRRLVVLAALGVMVTATIGATIALHDRAAATPIPRVDVASGASLLVSRSDGIAYTERALFWNRSIDRVLVLDDLPAPDGYPSAAARLSGDGYVESQAGRRIRGSVVVGADAAVLPEGSLTIGRDGLGVFEGPVDAIVVGYHRRGHYLTSYGLIEVAGGRILRVHLRHDPREALDVRCGKSRLRVLPRAPAGATFRVAAPPGTAKRCTFRLVRGGIHGNAPIPFAPATLSAGRAATT